MNIYNEIYKSQTIRKQGKPKQISINETDDNSTIYIIYKFKQLLTQINYNHLDLIKENVLCVFIIFHEAMFLFSKASRLKETFEKLNNSMHFDFLIYPFYNENIWHDIRSFSYGNFLTFDRKR